MIAKTSGRLEFARSAGRLDDEFSGSSISSCSTNCAESSLVNTRNFRLFGQSVC